MNFHKSTFEYFFMLLTFVLVNIPSFERKNQQNAKSMHILTHQELPPVVETHAISLLHMLPLIFAHKCSFFARMDVLNGLASS